MDSRNIFSKILPRNEIINLREEKKSYVCNEFLINWTFWMKKLWNFHVEITLKLSLDSQNGIIVLNFFPELCSGKNVFLELVWKEIEFRGIEFNAALYVDFRITPPISHVQNKDYLPIEKVIFFLCKSEITKKYINRMIVSIIFKVDFFNVYCF